MGPKKKESKESELKKKEKELKEKEKELEECKKELKEKEELSESKSPKKLSPKEKEKLINKIKEKYIKEEFYCVAERKKGVKIEKITEVDISRFPYRIIGICKNCKKPISKFISSSI